MKVLRSFSIKGIGSYLPTRRISSSSIEDKLGLPSGWISKFMGVKFRHRAQSETNTSMGYLALLEALEYAEMDIRQIDCLIAASATFDFVLPSRSALVKAEFRKSEQLDFPCIDISTVCTSFISAIEYASHLIHAGSYKNIAIVSSEIATKGLNPNDPETFGLFGDGAAAVILSSSADGGGLIRHKQQTFVESVRDTIIEGGGNVRHPRDFAYNPKMHSFKMEGKRLLRSAWKYLPDFVNEISKDFDKGIADIDWIVPHQASKSGIKMFLGMEGVEEAKVVNELANRGNCIAASIPLALDSAINKGKLKEGDSFLMIGTAAGLTIEGATLIYKKT